MNRYNLMHNGIEVSPRLSKRVVICNTSTIANIPRGNNWTKKDSPSHFFRLPQLEEKFFLFPDDSLVYRTTCYKTVRRHVRSEKLTFDGKMTVNTSLILVT